MLRGLEGGFIKKIQIPILSKIVLPCRIIRKYVLKAKNTVVSNFGSLPTPPVTNRDKMPLVPLKVAKTSLELHLGTIPVRVGW